MGDHDNLQWILFQTSFDVTFIYFYLVHMQNCQHFHWRCHKMNTFLSFSDCTDLTANHMAKSLLSPNAPNVYDAWVMFASIFKSLIWYTSLADTSIMAVSKSQHVKGCAKFETFRKMKYTLLWIVSWMYPKEIHFFITYQPTTARLKTWIKYPNSNIYFPQKMHNTLHCWENSCINPL